MVVLEQISDTAPEDARPVGAEPARVVVEEVAADDVVAAPYGPFAMKRF